MKKIYFFSGLLLTAVAAWSQRPAEGKVVAVESVKCSVTPAQQEETSRMLKLRVSELIQKGIIKENNAARTEQVLFDWPLRQAAGFNDRSYYTITNFADHNAAAGQILDYNCLGRTYDGHWGTDIATYPHGWTKMNNNAVEVIAAAEGTIIAKYDGYFDQNCAMCVGFCRGNEIYIRHADGSVAYYLHMKAGSLTGKDIGSPVQKGEYLGVVGSSGSSTGPHLHFEVHASDNTLIDPFAGTCNSKNGATTWWNNQKPYFDPFINKVMTVAAEPILGCATQESFIEKNIFKPGEPVYFVAFFRDLLLNKRAAFRIYRPDNTEYSLWDYDPTSNLSTAYAYIWTNLPTGAAALGTWKAEITYNNETVTHQFTVSNATPAPTAMILPLKFVSLCPGQTAKVDYSTSSSFAAGNKFTAYLSDGYGNFANEIAVGNINSVTTGQVNITIPANTVAGPAYKLRIKSSNPVTVTEMSLGSIFINTAEVPVLSPAGTVTACQGNTVALSTAATGTLQWYKDGALINGVSAKTYSAETTGSYTVKTTNISGCSATSVATTVTINPIPATPVITAGTATAFCTGGNVILTSNATAGNQWYKDGAIVNSATNSTLTVNSSGNFTVKVKINDCESAVSNTITVTVNAVPAAPVITQITNQLSSNVASGNQWYKDGVLVTGATSQTYTPTTAGNYTAKVTTNGCSSEFSNSIAFTVTAVPDIDVLGDDVKIFPNPVNDKLVITRSTNALLLVRLTDISGRQLLQYSSNALRIEIPVEKFSAGVIVVWIEDRLKRKQGKRIILKL